MMATKQPHHIYKTHTIQKLQQLPLNILNPLLLSLIKSPLNIESKSQKLFSWLQQLSSQLPQQLSQIDVHQHQLVVLWIFVRFINAAQKQLILYNKINQYLESHCDYQEIIEVAIKFIYDYNCATSKWINYKHVNSFFSNQPLYMLLNIELSHLKTQSLNVQTQFINYLQEQLLNQLVSKYLKQPSSLLFNILKLLLQTAIVVKPSSVKLVTSLFIPQYISQIKQKWLLISQQNKRQLIKIQPSVLLKTFLHLKLIQLLHIADKQLKISQLLTQQSFLWSQLYPILCNFDIKGSNALAINIYGAIMKQIEQFDQDLQVFIDVYLTLDSYGMHLIRDIWSRFYILCRNAHKTQNKTHTILLNNASIYYYKLCTTQYLHILLQKVQQHSNSNVPKHCIQSLLNESIQSTAPIFEYLQDTVYGSLVQILNTGTHYTDITHFHQDSKMYGMVCRFYLNYYTHICTSMDKDKEIKLKRHVSKLIQSMHKFITFEHCIVAYISILDCLPILSQKYLQLPQAQTLVQLSNKFYIKLTFRKRYKITKCILNCIRNYVQLKGKVSLKEFMGKIGMKLPKQMVVFRNIYTNGEGQVLLWSIIRDNYDQTQIYSRIQELKQIIKQQRINLLKIKDMQIQEYQSEIQQYQYNIKQLTILSFLNIKQQQQSQQLRQTLINFKQISSYTNLIDIYTAIYTLYTIANYCYNNNINEIGKYVVKYQAIQSILQTLGNANILISAKNGEQMIRTCLEALACGITSSNNSTICKSYAKFIQYNISMIKNTAQSQCSHYHLELLLDSLKFKIKYTTSYVSIEDCLYNLYQVIIKYNTNKINTNQTTENNQLSTIPASSLLRLQLLLFKILCNDPSYCLKCLHQSEYRYLLQIRQYCNLYDYSYYQQLFTWITSVCKLVSKAHNKNKIQSQIWQQWSTSICTNIKQCIKSMLHNLDYGIHVKEVQSCTQAVIQICAALQYSQQVIQLVEYVLHNVGQQYWGFQRCIVFGILAQIQLHSHNDIPNTTGVIKLLTKFICLQQYRGEDSAILLPQFYTLPVYLQNRLHIQSDYDGTALRFATIDWCYRQMNNLIQFHQQNKINDDSKYMKGVQFWMKMFQQCVTACTVDCGKDRMFLTGGHKNKIKHCQLLMCFTEFLHVFCTQQKICEIILTFLNTLCQPNLVQIKHYLQVFFLRLLFKNRIASVLPKISKILIKQLLEIQGQSGLLKNVTFMMIAGLVLQLQLQLQKQQKLKQNIKQQSKGEVKLNENNKDKVESKWWRELYAVLLSSVCSHIAYFRGISQYFCYSIVQMERSIQRGNHNRKDSKYIDILYNEYLKDKDAIRLTEKLQKIVQKYKNTIANWSIYEHLLCLKPTINGEVVSEDHYIDKLKYLSYELIKQHRHEDGYMPYKEAWKKIQIQFQQKEIMKNNSQQDNKKQLSTNQNSFQRKIDPSLDDLYNFETNIKANKNKSESNLKVLVVSAEQIAFYGHMARVGEILGISELIIPTLTIVDMEDFYNVSVTAEKWLKITQHKFQYAKQGSSIKKQAPQKSKKPSPTKPSSNKQSNRQQKQLVPTQIQTSNSEQLVHLLSILQSHTHQGYTLFLINKTNKSYISIQDVDKLQQEMPKKCLLVIDQLGAIREQLEKMCVGVCFNQYYSEHVQATIFMWTYFKRHTSSDAQ